MILKMNSTRGHTGSLLVYSKRVLIFIIRSPRRFTCVLWMPLKHSIELITGRFLKSL